MNTYDDIQFEMQGAVAVVRLNRGAKRNALSDGLVLGLQDIFSNLPEERVRPSSTATASISVPGWTCPS